MKAKRTLFSEKQFINNISISHPVRNFLYEKHCFYAINIEMEGKKIRVAATESGFTFKWTIKRYG